MAQRTITGGTIILCLILLSACAADRRTRALEGGALGLAVGAGAAVLSGGSVLGAAVVGGAVGAFTGAATDQSQLDLDG
ncbi:MAG: hypothetical protein AAFQ51_14650 [Pseudomonadota bacterium]